MIWLGLAVLDRSRELDAYTTFPVGSRVTLATGRDKDPLGLATERDRELVGLTTEERGSELVGLATERDSELVGLVSVRDKEPVGLVSFPSGSILKLFMVDTGESGALNEIYDDAASVKDNEVCFSVFVSLEEGCCRGILLIVDVQPAETSFRAIGVTVIL